MFDYKTFYKKWVVKEHIENNDLCHIDQIKIVRVGNIVDKIEPNEILSTIDQKIRSTVCNVQTLEFIVNCPKPLISHLRRGGRTWFLGTKFIKLSSQSEMFPVFDSYMCPSFCYSDFIMTAEDYIAVFS